MKDAIRLAQKDRAALEDLSRRYSFVLRRYFERRNLTGADAEDAVQEVFAKLANRSGISAIESLEGYLFETAANVAIDHFRRSGARHAQAHDLYEDGIHAVEDFSPERIHEGRETLVMLLTILNELPARTRNIFILARLEQFTYPEIAKRLGVSVSAVEKHVVKAAAHLALRVGGA